MNAELISNLDKYYGYARKIAGDLGEDLLHHIIEKIPDDVEYLDRYVWLTLKNEYYNSNSSFSKIYGINQDVDYDRLERVNDNTYPYSISDLYAILLELEREGYELEVKVFKECYLAGTKKTFKEKTGLSRTTIDRICIEIINEIRIRYVRINQNDEI